MICCARRKRARLVSHSRLAGLGIRLKTGRSWFDSRGWDDWIAGRSHALPTAFRNTGDVPVTTKQACRGDRPVRHTDRGRFDSGRLLRTCDLEGEECPRVARTAAEVRVTRRTSHRRASPDANQRNGQHAPKARRALRDAYTTRIVAALPGPSCPRTIRSLFPRRVDVVNPRIRVRTTGSSPRRSWWSCHADLARASCTAQQCEGAAP